MANDFEKIKLTHGSLFSGIGGFELGAERQGIETLWNCELIEYNRRILKQHFPKTKQYNDITKMEIPGKVNIISGGFPCQDISIAKVTGQNGIAQGIKGNRSGLWAEMYRIVRGVRPEYIIIENSSAITFRGLERVLCDLSEIGYNAEWQSLSGTTFRVQQIRERTYIVAYPSEVGLQGSEPQEVFSKCALEQFSRVYPGWRTRRDIPEPRTYRSTHDLSNLVDRIKAGGNAVMPIITEYIFFCIKAREKKLSKKNDYAQT
jgi:DNA (cytosine-5)-methyltransferase 1